jgi:hypothetical protein
MAGEDVPLFILSTCGIVKIAWGEHILLGMANSNRSFRLRRISVSAASVSAPFGTIILKDVQRTRLTDS